MDGLSFFNIGMSELFFIAVMAGLFLGPGRIRIVARKLGEWTAYLQGISRQFRNQLNAELDDADKEDLKAAMEDIKSLQRQVKELRGELLNTPRNAVKEGQATFSSQMKAATKSIGAPVNGAENSIGAIAPALPSIVDVEDDPE